MFKFVALTIVLLSSNAFAQMTQLPERGLPIPPDISHSASNPQTWEAAIDAAPAPLPAHPIVDRLAAELDRQFKALAATTRPSTCTDKIAPSYATQLLISQKFDDCVAYAKLCAQDAKLTDPQVIEIGAECEAARFRPVEAKALYDLATSARFASSPDFAATVLKAAADAYVGIYERETSAILEKAFPKSDVTLWKAVIGEAEVPPHTPADVRAFLERQISESSGRLLSILKAFKIRKSETEYAHAKALNELSRFITDVESPYAIYSLAYKIVYASLDKDFAQARKIYDVFDQYAGPTWKLPTEQNTYNYSEIYGSVCKDQLLAKQDRADFDSIREKLRTGLLAPAESLAQIEAIKVKFPGKADVLTTYGGLLALNGRHEEAMRAYWKAHRACRYYNRANWGLTLETRYLKYHSYPEFDGNEKRVTTELAQRQIPPEISTYFRNWSAFDRETQKRIEYGSRTWLPYIPALKANDFTTYIKFSFDLLSESPTLARIRDIRIGGANYPNDNRLWDDVRGLGGETVIADAAEVFQTVQGDYNLLGHEMAHQFQQLLEKVYTPGFDCIVRLYDEAKARGRFPDGYSAQNKEEHFAQGVTYSMIPADSPKRFGTNRGWLTANDPNQLGFIKSIESASGDLGRISCSN
jgi:hypothetical protein